MDLSDLSVSGLGCPDTGRGMSKVVNLRVSVTLGTSKSGCQGFRLSFPRGKSPRPRIQCKVVPRRTHGRSVGAGNPSLPCLTWSETGGVRVERSCVLPGATTGVEGYPVV